VFPAIPEATEKAEAAWKAKGVDTNAFTVQVDEKTTSLFPITDYASQIEGIMEPAMDNVLTGKAPPESLTEANNQVSPLFG
jgi:multiple sugar transport system substrate-binding protein